MCGRVFNPYAMRSGASLSRCHDANVAIFPISRIPFGTIFFYGSTPSPPNPPPCHLAAGCSDTQVLRRLEAVEDIVDAHPEHQFDSSTQH